jgi:hypothetical protein
VLRPAGPSGQGGSASRLTGSPFSPDVPR